MSGIDYAEIDKLLEERAAFNEDFRDVLTACDKVLEEKENCLTSDEYIDFSDGLDKLRRLRANCQDEGSATLMAFLDILGYESDEE